jgi:hypothetical protein
MGIKELEIEELGRLWLEVNELEVVSKRYRRVSQRKCRATGGK